MLTHHDSSTIKIARLSPSPTQLPTSQQIPIFELRTSTNFRAANNKTPSDLHIGVYPNLSLSPVFSMSSTMSCLYSPDDYADLVTPWKPVTQTAMKNISSTYDRVEIDHGVQVSNLADLKSSQCLFCDGKLTQNRIKINPVRRALVLCTAPMLMLRSVAQANL